MKTTPQTLEQQIGAILRVFGPGAVVVFLGPAPCADCAARAARKEVRRER